MKKLLTASVALIALGAPLPALSQDETTQDDTAQDSAADEEVAEEEPINFEEPEPEPLGRPSPEAVSYMVNGQDFTLSYMMKFAGLLVPNLEQYNIELIYPIVTNLAVEQVLAAEKAREMGLDMTPELQADLQLVVNSILSNAYLEQQIEAELTDEAVQAAYEAYVAEFEPQPLATASHILLETEEDALAAIERLDMGEDFAELAMELSTGPAGPGGGGLGTFGMGQMVEPFEAAVFAMEPGTYSAAPVQTQFGYHLIFLTELTETSPDGFDAMAAQLRAQLEEEIQTRIREELREAADYIVTPFAELERAEQETAAPEDTLESTQESTQE